MTRASTVVMLWAMVAVVLVVPSVAQQPATEGQATSLEGIDRSLKQIVELLRIQIENQRAELAVQRLDIARRELVTRERELHEAEQNRDRYAEAMEELEVRIDTYGSSTVEESGMEPEDFEFMRRQIDLEVESVKQSLWRTDQRIIDLRKEISRVHEDLDSWERVVAESLSED